MICHQKAMPVGIRAQWDLFPRDPGRTLLTSVPDEEGKGRLRPCRRYGGSQDRRCVSSYQP